VQDVGDPIDALAVNREKEPQWIGYYTKRLNEEGEMYRRTLTKEAINYCNISPETDRKYREKWVADFDYPYNGPGNFLFETYRETKTGKEVIRLRSVHRK
jgi:hypothetical protein